MVQIVPVGESRELPGGRKEWSSAVRGLNFGRGGIPSWWPQGRGLREACEDVEPCRGSSEGMHFSWPDSSCVPQAVADRDCH